MSTMPPARPLPDLHTVSDALVAGPRSSRADLAVAGLPTVIVNVRPGTRKAALAREEGVATDHHRVAVERGADSTARARVGPGRVPRQEAVPEGNPSHGRARRRRPRGGRPRSRTEERGVLRHPVTRRRTRREQGGSADRRPAAPPPPDEEPQTSSARRQGAWGRAARAFERGPLDRTDPAHVHHGRQHIRGITGASGVNPGADERDDGPPRAPPARPAGGGGGAAPSEVNVIPAR
jgi:hypothetical protein